MCVFFFFAEGEPLWSDNSHRHCCKSIATIFVMSSSTIIHYHHHHPHHLSSPSSFWFISSIALLLLEYHRRQSPYFFIYLQAHSPQKNKSPPTNQRKSQLTNQPISLSGQDLLSRHRQPSDRREVSQPSHLVHSHTSVPRPPSARKQKTAGSSTNKELQNNRQIKQE